MPEFHEVEGFAVGEGHFFHFQAEFGSDAVARARPQKIEALQLGRTSQFLCAFEVLLKDLFPGSR